MQHKNEGKAIRVSNHKNLKTENLKGSLNKAWVMTGMIDKES